MDCGGAKSAERSRLNERASNLSFVCVVAAPPPPGKERQTPTTATERRKRDNRGRYDGWYAAMVERRRHARPELHGRARRRQTDKPQKVIMRKYKGGRGG